MSIGQTVTVTGGDRVAAVLNSLVLQADEKQKLFSELGDALISQTVLRFASQTDPDGNAWKPSQRALADGGQTLLDTGRLRGSITKLVSGDQVEVGTNLIYALPMQYGLTLEAQPGKFLVFQVKGQTVFAKKISYPGRAFIGLNDSDEQELVDTVAAFLTAIAGGALQ